MGAADRGNGNARPQQGPRIPRSQYRSPSRARTEPAPSNPDWMPVKRPEPRDRTLRRPESRDQPWLRREPGLPSSPNVGAGCRRRTARTGAETAAKPEHLEHTAPNPATDPTNPVQSHVGDVATDRANGSPRPQQSRESRDRTAETTRTATYPGRPESRQSHVGPGCRHGPSEREPETAAKPENPEIAPDPETARHPATDEPKGNTPRGRPIQDRISVQSHARTGARDRREPHRISRPDRTQTETAQSWANRTQDRLSSPTWDQCRPRPASPRPQDSPEIPRAQITTPKPLDQPVPRGTRPPNERVPEAGFRVGLR